MNTMPQIHKEKEKIEKTILLGKKVDNTKLFSNNKEE